MKFPPTYSVSDKAKELLYGLDVLKSAWALQSVEESRITDFRRKTFLQSSLFSARIEGNPLTESDITGEFLRSENLHKREVSNLFGAYQSLAGIIGPLTVEIIQKLHGLTLAGISGEAGHFRTEDSAIFNQAGVAVYVPPAPYNVRRLVDELTAWSASSQDKPPVTAAVAHIWFEKIHPFLDGNGRVGRLLAAWILHHDGYDFGGIVPFEKYLDEHRDGYYAALGPDRQDVSEFIDFFLTALLSQANESLAKAKEAPIPKYSELLPRRAELLEIIRDHKMVTFDFLSRRFRAIPTRTLHYDLSQLTKRGLIKKLGSTRGVVYTPSD